MSRETKQNIPDSIRQRLLDRSRQDGRPFNEILQYFAMERFLYRLSHSPWADRFILKGAMMLGVWHAVDARSTMDIDVLGKMDNAENTIQDAVRGILAVSAPEDGITFHADTIATARITEDAEYYGVRVSFRGHLGSARITMKLDIGFGDIVFPKPEWLPLPAILVLPGAELLCYSRESAIAEKCQAMVKLGSLNSRMKDFFDIWLLCRQFNFEGAILSEALRLTFENRETSLDGLGVFTPDFSRSKQVQWSAFRTRMKLDHAPNSFSIVLDQLSIFLSPFGASNREVACAGLRWIAPGPWVQIE